MSKKFRRSGSHNICSYDADDNDDRNDVVDDDDDDADVGDTPNGLWVQCWPTGSSQSQEAGRSRNPDGGQWWRSRRRSRRRSRWRWSAWSWQWWPWLAGLSFLRRPTNQSQGSTVPATTSCRHHHHHRCCHLHRCRCRPHHRCRHLGKAGVCCCCVIQQASGILEQSQPTLWFTNVATTTSGAWQSLELQKASFCPKQQLPNTTFKFYDWQSQVFLEAGESICPKEEKVFLEAGEKYFSKQEKSISPKEAKNISWSRRKVFVWMRPKVFVWMHTF